MATQTELQAEMDQLLTAIGTNRVHSDNLEEEYRQLLNDLRNLQRRASRALSQTIQPSPISPEERKSL